MVGLYASPSSGYRVKAWHGTDNDSSTAAANTITMSGNVTVFVEFEQIPPVSYTLSTSVSGGNGSISPSGTYTYAQGSVVSLSASPSSGYRVKAWHGTDNDSSTATTNTVIMSTSKVVTIEFTQNGLAVPAASPIGYAIIILILVVIGSSTKYSKSKEHSS